jgi:hypothetical protein
VDRVSVIPAPVFEAGLDLFFEQVIERLQQANLKSTNFASIWTSLTEERRNPETARVRKLEALCGKEPDESEPDLVDQMIADSQEFGTEAIDELAAECGQSGKFLSAADVVDMAKEKGFHSTPRNAASFRFVAEGNPGMTPAWRVGVDAAKGLREEIGNKDCPISDKDLADVMGVDLAVLGEDASSSTISLAIEENDANGSIALRPKWVTGRRFELARLLGDRVAGPRGGKLFPATHTYTYRQKMQRSFAAEFLSPFEAVDNMLAGDYSPENQDEIAEHYRVSPRTIQTMLVNHKRLDRDELLSVE